MGEKYRQKMICVFGLSLLTTAVASESMGLPKVQYRDGDILIGGLAMVHADQRITKNGIHSVETINMVVDQTNRDETILPGVKLGTMIIDSKWNEAHTSKMIIEKFLPEFSTLQKNSCRVASNESNLFAGIVGAVSSGVSAESAKLLQAFSIPQVSPWSTSPALSDKENFPHFFRTIPSDTHQIKSILAFAVRQRWNYMSIVFENTEYGNQASAAFEKIAQAEKICVAASIRIEKEPSPEECEQAVQKLTEKNARAVLIYGLKGLAFKMMTAAKGNPKADGKFLWIATEAWTQLLPRPIDNIENYESELDGVIGFAPKSDPVVSFDDYFKNLTIAKRKNSTSNPWFSEYISVQNSCHLEESSSANSSRKCNETEGVNKATFAPYPLVKIVANAALSLVHSLHAIHRDICKNRSIMCQEMKDMSGTNELGKRISMMLKNMSIRGIDGHAFQFDKYHDVAPQFYVYNYKKNQNVSRGKELMKWIKVAEISRHDFNYTLTMIANLSSKVTENRSVCSSECKENEAKELDPARGPCCWNCNECAPNDYVKNGTECKRCGKGRKPNAERTGCEDMETGYMKFDGAYGSISIVFGILGLVLTSLVIALHVKHRDSPVVKASGRELCFFTLCGVLLTFMNCFAITGSPTIASCVVSRLIFALGPTCMYSALLTKTLRVVIIFKSKTLTPKVKLFLQPSIQLMLTGLITIVQVFAVILWLTNSPARPDLHLNMDNQTVFYACNIMIQPLVLIGLIYPFLLIVICTVLATVNRNVPIGFNETKFIGLTMYTTFVIWLAFVPIFVTNEKNYELKLMTMSLCLSLSASTVLLCLFGQRCFILLFSPERNTKESVMSSKTPRSSNGKPQKGEFVKSATSARTPAVS